jgi:hypothetical protein
MSTVKVKAKEKKNINKDEHKVTTLDTKHKSYVDYFSKKKLSLPSLKNNLSIAKKQLAGIEKKDPSTFTTQNIRDRSTLKDKIHVLESEISKIENNVEEMHYYFKTMEILVKYYDDGDDNSKSSSQNDSKSDTNNSDDSDSDGSDYNMSDNCNNNEDNLLKYFGPVESKKKNKKNKPVKNKAELYDNYLSLVDSKYQKPKKINITRKCGECNIEQIINQTDGLVVCSECGNADIILIDSDKPNYKEPIPDNSAYTYKRMNHLNELLSQLQAKESTAIPKEVYDKILAEISKSKKLSENLSLLTPIIMRKILKKLGLYNYYEHIPHIINKLNKVPPPRFTREMEDKIRMMFKEIQEPFQKYCPKGRKNFLNYSYVIHKFCELLELDDFLPHLPLLKNNDKLQTQDKIWKKICDHLEWEYIPSYQHVNNKVK